MKTKVGENTIQRFTLRSVGPDRRYFEVALPREVVERAARKQNLSLEEFKEQYEVEALYDAFEGILYRFVKKESLGKAPPERRS